MDMFGGILFRSSCLIVATILFVDDVFIQGHHSICRPTPITSSLIKRLFTPDIIISDDIDKSAKGVNSSCDHANNNRSFLITGDNDTFVLKPGNDNQSIFNVRTKPKSSARCFKITVEPDSGNFKILIITNTAVSVIDPFAFMSWSHIEKLQIVSNNMLESIQANAFAFLTKVWELRITDNELLSSFHDYSFNGLVNLKALYLKRNGIKDISKISNALSKNCLPNLVHLDLSGNKILTIGEYDFKPMKNSYLYALILSQTGTNYIHPKALDIFGDNIATLEFTQMNVNKSVLLEFINNTSYMNKNLKYISLREDFLYGSPRELMEVMTNSVRVLDLRSNHFGQMTPGFFPVMHELMYFDLTNVMMGQIPEGIINSTVFPKLIHLYIKDNTFTKLTKAMITPNLHRLVVSSSPQEIADEDQNIPYFTIDESVLKTMPHLELLDLSGKKLNKLTPNVFRDAKALRVLLLHNTALTQINNRSFETNKLIYYLDLSSNMFPLVSSLNGEIFYGLSNLLALDLSNCYIQKLSNDLFEHVPELQYLSLRSNPISKLSPGAFFHVSNLKVLDIRYNILVSWNQEILASNHCLSHFILNYNSIMTLTDAMINDFKKVDDINLFANALTCDCNLYQILQRHRIDSKHSPLLRNTSCSYPADINKTLYEYLQQPYCSLCKCYDEKIAAGSACGLVAVLAIIILIPLYFRYKYEVQYRLMILKKKLGIVNIYRVKKGSSNRGFFQYDAFVSYSAHDSSFVEKMMMILEKDGSKYKLCVFERDFQPGDNLVERILECMDVSIVTILILTEAFAKSDWCRWEMSIAQNKAISQHFLKDSLILIIKSKIPESLMTPTLKYLMDTRVYLEWHENSSVRQNIFWEKLKDALKEKIHEPREPNSHIVEPCNEPNLNTIETVT